MLQNHSKKYISIICSLFIIIIGISNISLGYDEQFTMGLIHNTFSNIINFDILDVHPPLYYLLLKLFLQITTFWTGNILIKILFARMFSFIALIIIIYIGFKLLKFANISNLRHSLIPVSIIFLSIPSILLYSQYIRMYILAAMFLFIELYELIKYTRSNNIINCILAIITGSLAAYTHYFAAISAGLFLLYFCIKFLYHKDFAKSLKIALSGVIYLLLYVPWLIIAKKQFSIATSSKYATNQIYTKDTYTFTNFIHLIQQALFSLVGGQSTYGNKLIKIISVFLLILFIYFAIWSIRHLNKSFNSLLIISGINLLGTISVGLLVSVVRHPILIDHYLFPSFAVFIFFISYAIYQYILRSSSSSKFRISISCLIILMLFGNVFLYTGHNVKDLIKSHVIITKINYWHKSDYIYMINNKRNIWNIADDSIYLRAMHKDIKVNTFRYTNYMFGRTNVSLMHDVYPNVKK